MLEDARYMIDAIMVVCVTLKDSCNILEESLSSAQLGLILALVLPSRRSKGYAARFISASDDSCH